MSLNSSFNKFFRFFFDVIVREENHYHPFCPPIIGSNWALDSLSDNIIHPKLFSDAWKSIQTTRNLIFFPIIDDGKNNYCIIEVYNPHLALRKIGLN